MSTPFDWSEVVSDSGTAKRACRNPSCCTYNLEVTTAATKCIGCDGELPRVGSISGLGDLFSDMFGGVAS